MFNRMLKSNLLKNRLTIISKITKKRINYVNQIKIMNKNIRFYKLKYASKHK
jgi:hypothetical protein